MTSAFRVSYSGSVRAALRQLLDQAVQEDAAFGRLVLDALRKIDARLRTAARDWGEPCFTLRHLALDVRLGVVAPLAVTYGVHQQQAVVFIQGFELLSRPSVLE